MIATALFASYKSGTPIAIYILVCAIVSITATAFLKDYTGRDVSAEYEFRLALSAWPTSNPVATSTTAPLSGYTALDRLKAQVLTLCALCQT